MFKFDKLLSMSIKAKVEESLKWKKSVPYCAARLDISEKTYSKIKHEIISERKKKKKFFSGTAKNEQFTEEINLEKGEGKIAGTFDHEPKSPEEIVKLLKIDTKQWRLASYWNKQMGDHWRVSALITRVKQEERDYILDVIEKWEPKYYDLTKPDYLLNKNATKVCGIISLQDIHFGKQGNETIDKDFEDTLKDLLLRASASHHIEKLFFVVGGDMINMDSFSGTTTSGTPLDNCSMATDAYIQAFDAMHWGLNYAKAFCDELVVVYIPGNHDRLSSFHLAHALSKAIVQPNITWDIEYAERKVHVWHDNFNAFEHGDVPAKNTPLVYATEYAKEWGSTKNRTLFAGHYHQNRKVEYVTTSENTGFIHKTLPSLCKTDYYHYHNKYVGNQRAGKIELQHPQMGNICELTYQAL